MLYIFDNGQLPAGVNSFPDLPTMRAFPCTGIPDFSKFWLANGVLTLLYEKQTGPDVENLPGTIRSDGHAVTQCIYFLKAAFINGYPAEWNNDTQKFHMTVASGDPITTSSIDQTGVAFTP